MRAGRFQGRLSERHAFGWIADVGHLVGGPGDTVAPDDEYPIHTHVSNLLLTGTGTVIAYEVPEENARPRQPIVSHTAVHQASRW
ncbi:hypothetical protein ACFFWE_06160 [Sphaerisporangium melleum]|uniref:hypothetical protein n=1 Tax=Sphaerisporangium melleum TaxID=321316 RepID=UPI001668EE6F|nr:hypothetical protein [Sphaerisporangium melleum]